MRLYDADVVVVGAGFTGLSAAESLIAEGYEVLVLEARDRVGGRVESQVFDDGVRIDTGGQFLCDDMTEIMALAHRFGRGLVETPQDGDFVTLPSQYGQGYGGSMKIRARANRIDVRDPAIAGLTVKAWLERQDDTVDVKVGFQAMVEGLWCRSIGEIPLWYLIDNDRRVTSHGNELQYFPGDTMHRLAQDLAAILGERLRLSMPVVAVTRRDEAVEVTVKDGAILTARQVVVAVPPVMAGRINYMPALPQDLREALDAWRSGMVLKILVRYERPFWCERGLSGMVMWRDVPGLFACNVSHGGTAGLVVFAGGPLANQWSRWSQDAVRTEILRRLVEALGEEAADCTGFLMRNWVDDPWSGGGYSDVITDIGAYDAEDTIRSGAPPIHFAASELASSFPAYVEGAIIAGREAAERVIALLKTSS